MPASAHEIPAIHTWIAVFAGKLASVIVTVTGWPAGADVGLRLMLAGATWVAVAVGTGVLVGGTGVLVGGRGVLVGGTGVLVAGTDVLVGGTGVLIAETAVGAETGVFVGRIGVLVAGASAWVGSGPDVEVA